MPISKINTSSITDNSVTAGKIVAGAVDADIAAGSIDTAQIADANITTAKIADDAVTADKLANAINTSIAAKAPIASPSFTGNVVTQGVNPTITIQDSDEAGDGFIKFKTANGTQRGYIQTAMTSDVMIFGTGTTERMRLISSGGLTFNGDTAAANALDDYEEGTWTPVLTGGKTGSGNYVKIGRLVTVNFLFANIGGSGSTAQRVTALPFTSYTQNGGSYSEMYRIDFPSNAVDFILFTYASTTTLGMTFQVDDGIPIALTGAMLDHSSATLSGTITYQTS